jgi:hypothetical protein
MAVLDEGTKNKIVLAIVGLGILIVIFAASTNGVFR